MERQQARLRDIARSLAELALLRLHPPWVPLATALPELPGPSTGAQIQVAGTHFKSHQGFSFLYIGQASGADMVGFGCSVAESTA